MLKTGLWRAPKSPRDSNGNLPVAATTSAWNEQIATDTKQDMQNSTDKSSGWPANMKVVNGTRLRTVLHAHARTHHMDMSTGHTCVMPTSAQCMGARPTFL